jgi:formylmethanofuran dehydrogenase subunit C
MTKYAPSPPPLTTTTTSYTPSESIEGTKTWGEGGVNTDLPDVGGTLCSNQDGKRTKSPGFGTMVTVSSNGGKGPRGSVKIKGACSHPCGISMCGMRD